MNTTGKAAIAATACAACCAPLLWPFVSAALVGSGGSFAFGRYMDVDVDVLLCLVGPLLAGIGATHVGYRCWRRNREPAPGASCAIGGACDPGKAQR
jgi:hypothetical protein